MQNITAAVAVTPVAGPGSPDQALLAVKTLNLPKRSRLTIVNLLLGGDWVLLNLDCGELNYYRSLLADEGQIEVKGDPRKSNRVFARLVTDEFRYYGADVLDTETVETKRLLERPSQYERQFTPAARLGKMIEHMDRIKRARAARRQEYSLL
jgi:hypothetical protein